MNKWLSLLGILYANGGGKTEQPEPPDTEVDDVDAPEEDIDYEDEISKIFGNEEDDDEGDEEEESDESDEDDESGEDEESDEEEEDEEPEKEEEPSKEPRYKQTPKEKPGKTFTEEDVNRIVQDRLARKERQFQEQYKQVSDKLGQLESITGMDADKIITHVQQAQVKARADEWGISEEEANRILENEQKNQVMEQRLKTMEEENQQTKNMAQYDRDKQKFMSNPMVKQYESQIDAFAKNGAALNFEPAMKYVLGEAILEGKIDVNKDLEQKVLASRKKKGKTKPEVPGSGGGAETQSSTLTKEEKQLARNLGLPLKEYAASKKRLEKQKKARGN